jgi:hypothetical protein
MGEVNMARYLCHNCNDLALKAVPQVLEHVWNKHGIEATKQLQAVVRAEDARSLLKPTGKQKVSGYRCEACKVSLEGFKPFLTHIDKMHGIHIWYEKGLTKKRVFFDGVLESTSAGRTEQQKLLQANRRENIPLSKRLYEPRKKQQTS